MALSNTTVHATYTANGATATFAIPFDPIVDDSAETKVYLIDESTDPATETLQTEGVDYTLTGAPSVDDFHDTVSFVSAPASGLKVFIERELPLTQTLDTTANGRILPIEHEVALNRLTAMIQQINAALSRVLKVSKTSGLSDFVFPEPEANEVLGWNSDGDALENKSISDLVNLTGALAVANNLSDLSNVEAALSNLGISPFYAQSVHSVTDGQIATNLTGETFDALNYSSVVYEYEVQRGTTVFANGRFSMQYRNGIWILEPAGYEGDLHGVTFSNTQNGTTFQVRAALDIGAGDGTIKLKKHFFTA